MTDVDPAHALRIAAISALLGRAVGSDQLIQAALDAVLAGIDSPSLTRLAGLLRSEESEAQELFNHVIDELDLAPTLPNDAPAARWELVRWWCQLMVDGHLAPEVGGRLIWIEGWNELDYPPELQPLVGWVSEWEDWTEAWDLPRETYRERIIAAARQLIEQTRPPAPPPKLQP